MEPMELNREWTVYIQCRRKHRVWRDPRWQSDAKDNYIETT